MAALALHVYAGRATTCLIADHGIPACRPGFSTGSTARRPSGLNTSFRNPAFRLVTFTGSIPIGKHRDTASAEAFLAQALGRSGQLPSAVITDHHQP